MRRLSLFLFGLLLVAKLLVAWVALRLPGFSAAGSLLAFLPYTSEGEVRRAGCRVDTPARELRVRNTYLLPDGMLLVFTARCSHEPGMPREGGRVLGAWHTRRMEGIVGLVAVEAWRGSSMGTAQPSPDAPIVYDTYGDRGFALVYGRALKPLVVAVEVDFEDGQTLRDEAPDGIFAQTAEGASAACELRALDAKGRY